MDKDSVLMRGNFEMSMANSADVGDDTAVSFFYV